VKKKEGRIHGEIAAYLHFIWPPPYRGASFQNARMRGPRGNQNKLEIQL
jgi:hypothetical protein